MKTNQIEQLPAGELALPFTDNGQDVQQQVWFPNGYGVSIIRNPYSYGGKSGLFELAVIQPSDDSRCSWEVDHSTEITPSGVEGWKDVAGILHLMKQVHDLPAIGTAIESAAQQVIE